MQDYKSLRSPINGKRSTVALRLTKQEAITMDGPEQIGARLKRLRIAYGFAVAKQFANFVGISEAAWNHFETGRRPPTVPDAIKVAAKTGASLDWIYRGMEHTLPLHVAQKLEQVPVEQPMGDQRRSNARH